MAPQSPASTTDTADTTDSTDTASTTSTASTTTTATTATSSPKQTSSPAKPTTTSPTTSPSKPTTTSPTTSPTNSPSKPTTTSPTNSPSKPTTTSPTNSPSEPTTSSPTTSPTNSPTNSPAKPTTTNQNKRKSPPATKSSEVVSQGEPGLRGLKNLGLTCFINVVLQACSCTLKLREFFLDWMKNKANQLPPSLITRHSTTTCLAAVENPPSPPPSPSKQKQHFLPLCTKLHHILRVLWSGNVSLENSKKQLLQRKTVGNGGWNGNGSVGFVRPSSFVHSIWEHVSMQFVNYQQQDAGEFFEFLLGTLQEELNTAPKNVANVITELVEGKLVHTTQCCKCNNTSSKSQSFVQLRLSFPGSVLHNIKPTSGRTRRGAPTPPPPPPAKKKHTAKKFTNTANQTTLRSTRQSLTRSHSQQQNSSSQNSTQNSTQSSAQNSTAKRTTATKTTKTTTKTTTTTTTSDSDTPPQQQGVDLTDCLWATLGEEVLGEGSVYNCKRCGPQTAVRRCRFQKLPDVLIVSVGRIVHVEGRQVKVHNHVVFPTKNLDLSEFVDTEDCDCSTYQLSAVIVHDGSDASRGHYRCLGRHKTAQNGTRGRQKWFEFNDHHVTQVSESQVLREQAYILVYER